MTAEPCDQPAGEGPDDIGRLHELRQELDLWGLSIEDPAEGMPMSVLHLPSAWCEIDLRSSGALALVYRPLGRDLRAHEAVWLALALLDGNGPPGPAAAVIPDRRLPLREAAARALTARGMAAEPGQVGYGDGEVIPALPVSNPAGQSRGHLTITGEDELTWECRFPGPGRPGLPPSGIARAIAAALAGAAGEARAS